MKRILYVKSIALTLIVSLLLIIACKKSDPKESDENKTEIKTLVINTTTISTITKTTAKSGGSISNNSGETIIACGVCWSTSLNPTIADNKTVDGAGADIFISNITGLTIGTTYYVRAYATHKNETVYGNQISFTTESELPILSTNPIKSIAINSASSGGIITSTGGTITASGVCWSTSENPTTANYKTVDGNSSNFTSNLTGLNPGTTYYVRAYATNPAGTAYGEQLSFKTQKNINIEFVDVQGGTFIMGCGTGQSNCASIETPKHSVTLNSFKISKYEVTEEEFEAVMGSNPSYNPGCPKCPVENMIWYDILIFCNKLSIMKGITPVYSINGSTNPDDWGKFTNENHEIWDAVVCNWSANGYRMPTEAEWEYAARGGTHYIDYYLYSGSNDINAVAYYKNNSQDHKKEVGILKQPNQLGIYDMSGNVAEWCCDWIGYYYSTPQTNPIGASSGASRVLRGGSYGNDANLCRSSSRLSYYPQLSAEQIGIRLVLRQ